MEHHTDIFDYIKSSETAFKQPIQVNGKAWSMQKHITRSALYRDSDIEGTKTDFTPIKNITRPILNLQYRAEDIDVRDVQLYVDDPENYHLSFLVKKYHDDVFVQMYDLDSYFDELNQARIDFGGGLSKSIGQPCPEVVPLQSVAFCDQTDILSGPIGLKHYFSPDELLEMGSRGWGKEENGATATLKQTIELSREEKRDQNETQQNKTPGRYIEVYEVHGNLPKRFADHTDTSGEYETRLFIVAFYQKKDSKDKAGIILYTAPETKSPFKLIKRDPIFGRALGFGGAEELFEAQVWTNYDTIRMQDMLDAASKTILKATGPNAATIVARNKVRDMDNLEIIEVGQDSDLMQVDTFPHNMKLFEESLDRWETHAQQMGSANDAIMGESPTSGTPFKLQELVVSQANSLHEYRRGKLAKHIEEIYHDWIIPHIQKKICEGAKFLSELSLEELQYVTEALVTRHINDKIKTRIIEGGEVPTPEEIEQLKEIFRDSLKKKGSKHFIEILKGEFKAKPLAVKVNVAGKQKNLAGMTDKIVNIFRFAFSNPQGFAATMQIPGMAKSFNEILEYSGLSPVDFTGIEKLAQPPVEEPAPEQPEPMPPLATANAQQ